MIKISKPFSAVALALFLFSCATAPAPVKQAALPTSQEAAVAYLDNFVASQMKKLGITGLSLALVDGDRTVLAKGYGLADKGKKIPATSETRFNIGSVSKLFTGIGIMKLVERGKIDLDAPITAYIPEFSIRTRGSSIDGITIRRLLTHHSGMPSDYFRDFEYGAEPPPDYQYRFRTLVAAVKDLYVATPPDTVFSYSNLSYSLLGVVIERVSGQDFESVMQDEIFAPLGMKDSSFLLADAAQTGYAKGYSGGKEGTIPAIRDIAAGALNTTAHDIALFMKAMIASSNGSGRFLERDTVREMWSVQNPDVPLDFGFKIGLTWWIFPLSELGDLPIVQHGGDLPPFHAFLAIAPEKDIGVAIAVNSSSGSSMDLSDIGQESLRVLLELKEGVDPYRPAAAQAAIPVPAELARSLEGYYDGSMLGFNQVRYRGGKLRVKVMGIWFDTAYYPDATLALKLNLLGFIPIRIGAFESMRFAAVAYGGKPWLSVLFRGLPMGPIEKIEPVPVPAAWMARLGKYAIANPDENPVFTSCDLVLDRASGFLMVRLWMGGQSQSLPLRPISDTEIATYGMGRSMNETFWVENPGPDETIHALGYVLKKK